MKSPNLILVALLAIIVTAFIFVISIADLQAPTVEDVQTDVSDTTDVEDENETKDGYLIFESEELGIRFTYPEEWGEIEEEIKDVTPSDELIESIPDYQGVTFRKEAVLKLDGDIFLTSYTAGSSADRGGYWGDISYLIEDEAYINFWCSSLDNRPTGNANEFDSCSDYTNLPGVTFVQLAGTTDYYGSTTENVDQYYAYHPDHDYYGITISTVNMGIVTRATDGPDSYEIVPQEITEQMYRVVMSLEYIN